MISQHKEDIVIKHLFGLLVFSAFGSALIIHAPSFSVNFSQITGLLLLAALVLHNAINKRQLIVLYGDTTSILIYLYFVSNFFSSLAFSDNQSESLKGCAVILTYVVIYIVARWAMKKLTEPEMMVSKLMRFNKWSAVFGLACMLISFVSGNENFGVSYGHLAQAGIDTFSNPLPSVRSLSLEPNFFGIVTSVILCLNLAIYLLHSKSTGQLIIIILLVVAVIFSYTRSVYVSLIIALLAQLILSKNIRLLLSLIKFGFAIVSLSLIAFYFMPDNSDVKIALTSRMSSLFEFEKGSGLGRVQSYQLGLGGFVSNPLFGNGTLSADTRVYNPFTGSFQELFGSAGWLNGALIQSLHDTGLIGFTIVLMIYLSVLYANYQAFRKFQSQQIEKSILLGFIAGNIILAITAQLSSTLWISFPYIYWAINMSFLSWARGNTGT